MVEVRVSVDITVGVRKAVNAVDGGRKVVCFLVGDFVGTLLVPWWALRLGIGMR